ncbi:MAG TPA: aldo/keto reductase [Pseudolabrys sp.]|jgi:diketogulonate reductase-like aldo/keto reductase|nr:aldo/keto reductase [Pseudolabrys sp.]
MPKFGLGTWRMGENARKRRDEVGALRHGIDLGVTLIDTAEMYGDGEAEAIVADAAGSDRDRLFIVSKVLPENASRRGAIAACERSLKRLKTDRIDLYLLHWRGSPPLSETLEAFSALRAAGKIIDWGVSNFDLSDMQELARLSPDEAPATNQVLYNLTRRGIEFDLVPWCRERHIPIMAYSPIEQGRMLNHPALKSVAQRREATPAQVALAWLLRQDGIIAIPKAGSRAHVEEDIAALGVTLDRDDLATLDRAFPPPTKARPLEML